MPTTGQTETRSCQVELRASERVELGHEMARHEVQIEALKLERAALNKRVRKHEQERNQIGHWLDTGKREQDIECWWRRSDVLREWHLQRPDTGETVEVRPFGQLDFTHELPFHADHTADPPDDDQAEHVVTADGEVLTGVAPDFVIGVNPAPVVQLLAPPPRRPAPKGGGKRNGKATSKARPAAVP